MSGFLIRSLVLSAVLTVALNVFLVWRGRTANRVPSGRLPHRKPGRSVVDHGDNATERPRVQVFVPWKAMLIASIGLTVTLNLVAWLAR
ncbi:MAG: DUF2905 family protein [Acidimicrobiia bacterium]|nr:DUF2905 family protein [Acidimicrobiia bacterium]